MPSLPSQLYSLNCSYNELTELPPIPPSLRILNCSDNNIEVFPDMPEEMNFLSIENNPHIYRFTHPRMINITNCAIRKLKDILYASKLKTPLRAWMWRAKERVAIREMHPDRVMALLDSGVEILDLDKYLL